MDFEKCCPDDSNFIFDRILIRLVGNEDSYKNLGRVRICVFLGYTCTVSETVH